MSSAKKKEDFVTRLPANQSEYWNSLPMSTRWKVANRFISLLCRQMDASAVDVEGVYYTTFGCTRTKTFLSFTMADRGHLSSGYEKDILGLLRSASSHLGGAYQEGTLNKIEEESLTEEDFIRHLEGKPVK